MRPRFWSSINKARPVLDTGLWGDHTVPIFSRRRYSRFCRSSRPPGADSLEPRLSSLQMAQALAQGFATPVFRLPAGQSRPRATTRGPPPAAPTGASTTLSDASSRRASAQPSQPRTRPVPRHGVAPVLPQSARGGKVASAGGGMGNLPSIQRAFHRSHPTVRLRRTA